MERELEHLFKLNFLLLSPLGGKVGIGGFVVGTRYFPPMHKSNYPK